MGGREVGEQPSCLPRFAVLAYHYASHRGTSLCARLPTSPSFPRSLAPSVPPSLPPPLLDGQAITANARKGAQHMIKVLGALLRLRGGSTRAQGPERCSQREIDRHTQRETERDREGQRLCLRGGAFREQGTERYHTSSPRTGGSAESGASLNRRVRASRDSRRAPRGSSKERQTDARARARARTHTYTQAGRGSRRGHTAARMPTGISARSRPPSAVGKDPRQSRSRCDVGDDSGRSRCARTRARTHTHTHFIRAQTQLTHLVCVRSLFLSRTLCILLSLSRARALSRALSLTLSRRLQVG